MALGLASWEDAAARRTSSEMRQGDVIDERFTIEHFVGSGGMGQVYRALDLLTGETVALKLLGRAGALELGQLSREAQALAMLRLPGVVRYTAHGMTAAGQPYLATEWLAGETLDARLSRGALTIAESVTLAVAVARTLGAIHRLGLVHRDLKPGNLMIVDGAIERVTLIDFGLAHDAMPPERDTSLGVIFGTPGYMAPEQVHGSADVDARADVFALGCILFECLTGQPVFMGDDPLSLLVRVLLEDAPPLKQLLPCAPAWLERLVARMLAKPRESRPRDGDAVATALVQAEEVETSSSSRRRSLPPIAPEITAEERQMMALLLVEEQAPTHRATLAQSEETARTAAIRGIVAEHGGRLELVQTQWMLAALKGAGAPIDLAVRAARCARAMQAQLGASMALVTGRAELAGKLPVGELIDRAVRLLPRGAERDPPRIRADEVTARLLLGRFEIAQDSGGFWLQRPLEEADAAPRLLGRAVPCVGRDRELGLLVDELRRCVEERSAGAVLVTAPAGLGKSRLRQELLRAARERAGAIEVWFAQADPMGAGSAFGLLSQALRRALGILEGEPLEARRRKLLSRVAQHARLAREAPRIATFLGELIGAPSPDDTDVKLMAARRNPMLMGDQIRRAWEDFLEAECAARPVVLVLEDLHWGDLPTVSLVDAGLRHARDLPWLVLAFGHPEVHTLFPGLWAERRLKALTLAPLTRPTCERLVREVLGDDASPALVDDLVSRADGNAFFLEELLRAAVEGRTRELPETVLATVQARLDALEPEGRRVLRAASIFGETFWRGGVEALVGQAEVSRWLRELCALELVIQHGEGRIAGEVEYRFRHTLIREAAYRLLTERDRRLGHALAGEWLERAGEPDAMALAQHFAIGGSPEQAAAAYLSAAEEALRGNDLDSAIERAERGVACGPEPATLGALRRIQAEALVWRGDLALAEQRGVEALERLPRGSAAWFAATIPVFNATHKQLAKDRSQRWLDEVLGTTPDEGAITARNSCLAECGTLLISSGDYALADRVLDQVKHEGSGASQLDIEVAARLCQAKGFHIAHLSDDLEGCIAAFEATLLAFEDAGDRRNACITRTNLGFCHAELGDFGAAEDLLRRALSDAQRMALHEVEAFVLHNLGLVLAFLGKVEEGEQVERAAIVAAQRMGVRRLEATARGYLARIALLAGDAALAEQEARASVELLGRDHPLCPVALAGLAGALLELGRTEEALMDAREAYSVLERQGTLEEGESLVRLVHAEALAANGELRSAAKIIALAWEHLMARAARISGPGRREQFLGAVPDNARILELARRWLG